MLRSNAEHRQMPHPTPARPPLSPNPATSRIGLLAGIPQEGIDEILAAAQVRRVHAKRNIVTTGDAAAYLFVLRKGRGRYFRLTETGDEVLLQLLSPGDSFGIGTMLKNPRPYIATAEAMTDVEMLIWDHATVRRFVGLYPQLGDNALRIVLQYLKRYVDRHVALVTKPADQRLAETLLSLGQRSGQILPAGVQVDVTNGQLGALADVSSFTASRLLSELERKGTVSKFRGKVLIHSPEALVAD